VYHPKGYRHLPFPPRAQNFARAVVPSSGVRLGRNLNFRAIFALYRGTARAGTPLVLTDKRSWLIWLINSKRPGSAGRFVFTKAILLIGRRIQLVLRIGCSHGSVSRPRRITTAHGAVATERMRQRVYSTAARYELLRQMAA